MERGEVAIVAGQFAALALVVILLGNYAGVGGLSASSTGIASVYWGPASANAPLQKNLLNIEPANVSIISVYYTLAQGTKVESVGASRLCVLANGTGLEHVYANLTLSTDAAKKAYFTFGSTAQPSGWTCGYTITLTDNLQQVTMWVTSVKTK